MMGWQLHSGHTGLLWLVVFVGTACSAGAGDSVEVKKPAVESEADQRRISAAIPPYHRDAQTCVPPFKHKGARPIIVPIRLSVVNGKLASVEDDGFDGNKTVLSCVMDVVRTIQFPEVAGEVHVQHEFAIPHSVDWYPDGDPSQLTKFEIQIQMRELYPTFNECGEKHGKFGEVALRFAILADGRVESVTTRTEGVPDGLRTCLEQTLAAARFRTGSRTITVTYPVIVR